MSTFSWDYHAGPRNKDFVLGPLMNVPDFKGTRPLHVQFKYTLIHLRKLSPNCAGGHLNSGQI